VAELLEELPSRDLPEVHKPFVVDGPGALPKAPIALVQCDPISYKSSQRGALLEGAPFLLYALTGPLWEFRECETCPRRGRHCRYLARVPLGLRGIKSPSGKVHRATLIAEARLHDGSRTSCQGQPGGTHCGHLRSQLAISHIGGHLSSVGGGHAASPCRNPLCYEGGPWFKGLES
jgi:hypothetical protein